MFRSIQNTFWTRPVRAARDLLGLSRQQPQPYEKPQTLIIAEEKAKERVAKAKEKTRERLEKSVEPTLMEFSMREYSDIKVIPNFSAFYDQMEALSKEEHLQSMNLFSEYNLKVLKAVCLRIQYCLEDKPFTTEEWNQIEKVKDIKKYRTGEDETKDPLEIAKDAQKAFRLVEVEYKKYTQVANQLNGTIFDTLRSQPFTSMKTQGEIDKIKDIWERRKKFATLKSDSLKELGDMLNMLENYLSMLAASFELQDKSIYETTKETINAVDKQIFGVEMPNITADDKEAVNYYIHDISTLIASTRKDLAQAMLERIEVAHKPGNEPIDGYYCEDVVYDTLQSLANIDKRERPNLQETVDGYKVIAPPRRTLSKERMNEFYAFIHEHGTEEQKAKLQQGGYGYQDFMESVFLVTAEETDTKQKTNEVNLGIDSIIATLNEDLKALQKTTETKTDLTASTLMKSFILVPEPEKIEVYQEAAEEFESAVAEEFGIDDLTTSFVFVASVKPAEDLTTSMLGKSEFEVVERKREEKRSNLGESAQLGKSSFFMMGDEKEKDEETDSDIEEKKREGKEKDEDLVLMEEEVTLDELPEKKKNWRKQCLKNLFFILNDEDKMAKALNTRKLINKNGKPYLNFDAAELRIALDAIDRGDNSIYSLHDPRLGNILKTAGFSDEEIKAMSLSDKIKYEAAVFTALAPLIYGDPDKGKPGEVFIVYNALYNETYDDSIVDDGKEFEKELAALAKPCIQILSELKLFEEAVTHNDPKLNEIIQKIAQLTLQDQVAFDVVDAYIANNSPSSKILEGHLTNFYKTQCDNLINGAHSAADGIGEKIVGIAGADNAANFVEDIKKGKIKDHLKYKSYNSESKSTLYAAAGIAQVMQPLSAVDEQRRIYEWHEYRDALNGANKAMNTSLTRGDQTKSAYEWIVGVDETSCLTKLWNKVRSSFYNTSLFDDKKAESLATRGHHKFWKDKTYDLKHSFKETFGHRKPKK